MMRTQHPQCHDHTARLILTVLVAALLLLTGCATGGVDGTRAESGQLAEHPDLSGATTPAAGQDLSQPSDLPAEHEQPAAVQTAAQPPAEAPPGWQYRLLDAAGQPLPFTSDEEILQLLRSATVVSEKEIDRGITRPLKLLLEQNGLQVHAVFRHVNVSRAGATRSKHKLHLDARDSYTYEVAAYELSRLLGINRVPPVVLRRLGIRSGSVQLWLEQTITEAERRVRQHTAPDQDRWQAQWQLQTLFDSLIANRDRNLGNTLIDPSWKLWFIDHTRAFVTSTSPLFLNRVLRCERGLWQRLQEIQPAVVKERLSPYLSRFEIDALLRRWEKLVAHLRRQIELRGEQSVLFDLPASSSGPAPWGRAAAASGS